MKLLTVVLVTLLTGCASLDQFVLKRHLSDIEGVSIIKKNQNAVVFFDAALFKFGSYQLDEKGSGICSQVAEVLSKKLGSRYLYIEGHTDNIGETFVNDALSLRRASTIEKCIHESGYDIDRTDVVGYGSEYPACDNNTPEGRGCNRRVEIVVVRYPRDN